MNESIYKYRKQLLIGVVIVLVGIVAVSIYFIIMNVINSATINITVAPSIAEVMIDGVKYGANGSHKMAPGEYEIVVSAEGFKTETETIEVGANETANILLYLNPEEGNDWYKEHPEDALIMGEVDNAETLKVLDKLIAENPILSQLPHEVDYFTDNYSNRVKYTITYELWKNIEGFDIIIRDYTGGNEKKAKKWLEQQGLDLETVKIRYEDLTGDALNFRAE